MRTIEGTLTGVGREEAKEIVREIEAKARANGWNPDPKLHDPKCHMKEAGNLTTEEICRYNVARAIVDQTVDINEGAQPGPDNWRGAMEWLRDAHRCASVYGPGCSDMLDERFRRIINSYALKLLTYAERNWVMPDTRKFCATVKAIHEREVVVNAESEEEARRLVRDLAEGEEYIEEIQEIKP